MSKILSTRSNPSRSLNTSFQPNADFDTMCSYVVRILGPSTLSPVEANVKVRVDFIDPPSVDSYEAMAELRYDTADALSGIQIGNVFTLKVPVPAGWYVNIVTENVNSTSTFTLVKSTETKMEDIQLPITAGAGLAKDGDEVMSVNVAGGLEIASDNVQIADNGVTTSKIADQAVSLPKLQRRTSGSILVGQGTGTDIAEKTPSGDVTIDANAVATIANNAVTNAKLADVGTKTVKGRTTAGTGDPEDLTPTQAVALLNNAGEFDAQVRTNRLDQMAAPTVSVSMNSQRLTNLADPVADQDGVTFNKLNQVVRGLDYKQSCRVATAAALPAYTAAGSGVGKTLTANANGALTVDGTAMAATNRVLVKDEGGGTSIHNGLYAVTQAGSAGTPWILTRTTDADENSEVTAGLYTFIEEGSTNADVAFILVTNDPITVDTTALTFTAFSSGVILAGDALEKVGDQLNVKVGAGLQIASDRVAIADDGVTGAMLAPAVAGPGLTQDGSGNLQANPDNSTLELNGDAMRVKPAGITSSELASASVTGVKIAAAVAGAGLSKDGSDNLQVNLGDGLDFDGDLIEVDLSEILQNAIIQAVADKYEVTEGEKVVFTGRLGLYDSVLGLSDLTIPTAGVPMRVTIQRSAGLGAESVIVGTFDCVPVLPSGGNADVWEYEWTTPATPGLYTAHLTAIVAGVPVLSAGRIQVKVMDIILQPTDFSDDIGVVL